MNDVIRVDSLRSEEPPFRTGAYLVWNFSVSDDMRTAYAIFLGWDNERREWRWQWQENHWDSPFQDGSPYIDDLDVREMDLREARTLGLV